MRAYLVDAGLADILPGAWDVSGASHADPPLIRLTRLDTAEAWDDLLPEILPPTFKVLGDPELGRRTFDILSELIDNAGTHGRSTAGTFVCAQRYTGSTSGLEPGVWLGIADGGRGIPNHLRLNPKYSHVERDEQLIQLARRPWVTGTADHRGWGLVEVFEEATAAGPSEVLIRSGRGEATSGFVRDCHRMPDTVGSGPRYLELGSIFGSRPVDVVRTILYAFMEIMESEETPCDTR